MGDLTEREVGPIASSLSIFFFMQIMEKLIKKSYIENFKMDMVVIRDALQRLFPKESFKARYFKMGELNINCNTN